MLKFKNKDRFYFGIDILNPDTEYLFTWLVCLSESRVTETRERVIDSQSPGHSPNGRYDQAS